MLSGLSQRMYSLHQVSREVGGHKMHVVAIPVLLSKAGESLKGIKDNSIQWAPSAPSILGP